MQLNQVVEHNYGALKNQDDHENGTSRGLFGNFLGLDARFLPTTGRRCSSNRGCWPGFNIQPRSAEAIALTEDSFPPGDGTAISIAL